MKFTIKHEIKGRMRVHLAMKDMTYEQADILHYFLCGIFGVKEAKVYERTANAAIVYTGTRRELLHALQDFRFDSTEVPADLLETSNRELNAAYKEKLIGKVVLRTVVKYLVPMPVRTALTLIAAGRYIWKGARSLVAKKLEVSVLDGAAIAVSLLRGNFATAASVMFMLDLGEILEDWTHKKSVTDLARSMSLNISKVWLRTKEQDILVKSSEVRPGDTVIVHKGNVIPFDGVVIDGEGMVNQASLTGEAMPVRKQMEGYVYAGTVLEEGELAIEVRATKGATRYEKIVRMIEDSEKLKSQVESKAEHLADRLVPYTLLGTVLVGLLTRNATKALAVLMVDFSCALKLAMPISVLSAIREGSGYQMTIKGGKYLEAVSLATTIVFDKTGTLTKAKPVFKEIITLGPDTEEEMLKIAACLEEHFPHSMAKAVVDAAAAFGIEHKEMHTKVEYIVAHGISTTINGLKSVIGSYHFVFEDEKCIIEPAYQAKFDGINDAYSRLFLAIDGVLRAVICIEDPVREEAGDVVIKLREAGFKKIVMMTGDSKKAATAVAKSIGVDEYYYEVLPEDKAGYIAKEREKGRTVIMVGDGINDSPALSQADVGMAISDGAEIAREIADITIASDNLYGIVTLKKMSNALMKRISRNYRMIVAINTALIAFGVGGMILPTTSALLHNLATLGISVRSMQNLLSEHEES